MWYHNLPTRKVIKLYPIKAELKIMKIRQARNINVIAMLNNLLIDNITNKQIIGVPLSKDMIAKFFIEWNFSGKGAYIDFLSQYNGLFFPEGLLLEASAHDIEMEVETFYDLCGRLERYWDIAKDNIDIPKKFTMSHIPIADDAAGNEYWINLITGEVVFIEVEYGIPEGVHIVADNFSTFYSALRPMH